MSIASVRRTRARPPRRLVALICASGAVFALCLQGGAQAKSTPKLHVTVSIGVLGTTAGSTSSNLAGAQPGTLSYYDYLGLLRPALAKQGITIGQIATFAGGPALSAAIQSGAIDVGLIDGDTPVLEAVAGGIPLKILAAPQTGIDAWLVVGPHGPTSVAGLKGKAVGDLKGTYIDRYIAGILADHHLAVSDVTEDNLLPAAALPALQNGDIAAYPTGPAQAITVEHQIGGKIIDKASVSDPKLTATAFTVASSSFLNANPGLAKAWDAVQAEAAATAHKSPRQFFAYVAQQDGLPVNEVLSFSNINANYPAATLTTPVIAKLKATLAFLVKYGYVKAGAVNINSLIAPGVTISKK